MSKLDLTGQAEPATPSAGVITLYAGTDTLHSLKMKNENGDVTDLAVGRGVIQNIQNGNYTLVASDFSKHIYREGTATGLSTWTIPANASVPFIVGTPVSFANDGTGIVTIAISTDTLVQAATGSTGNRTLPQYGLASGLKVTSTRWVISGAGLT